jgi:hypothetical protein
MLESNMSAGRGLAGRVTLTCRSFLFRGYADSITLLGKQKR